MSTGECPRCYRPQVVPVGTEEVLPTDFGKYRLVKKIATGGMAEIFLAHRHDTPNKPIVIKRILPHLVKGGEFVSMFLDEARIAAQLNHPNIVQIFDVGQIAGSYFIAMEYVHGEDIRRIYNAAYRLQRSLPLSHSIRVIADAALGLGYAHKLTDFAGRPMGVVHRDVSPQNILVTYEGGVKVVDFGIAKAANKVNQTRAGVLKGKYSYMSPEQALGDPIDHRTDIFALGIILYETTTGTRLFKRHNELATLQAIIKCEVVLPSEALPGYPPDLEEVLLKSLAKNPDERYGDAAEFSAALYDFLHTSELYVEREVIAGFMADLFKERLDEERGTGEPALPDEDEVKEEMREATTPSRDSRTRPSAEQEGGATPSRPLDSHDGEGTGLATTFLRKKDPKRRREDEGTVSDGTGLDGESEVDFGEGNGPGGTHPEVSDGDLAQLDFGARSDLSTQEKAVAYGGSAKAVSTFTSPPTDTDLPATALSAKARANRQSTEIMRPSADDAATKANGTSRLAGDPEATPDQVRSGDPPSLTEAAPPPDMLPTVAAQPVYPGGPSSTWSGDAPPSVQVMREIEPERSEIGTGRMEPTEQVRLRDRKREEERVAEAERARAAEEERTAEKERSAGRGSDREPDRDKDRDKDRDRDQRRANGGYRAERSGGSDRDRARDVAFGWGGRPLRERPRTPTATEIHRGLVPRIAIALTAVVAAVLAGILASRIIGNLTEHGPVESSDTERYGRVTLMTEPGASVFQDDHLLGKATDQGVAGPFRMRAGEQRLRAVLEDAGFERERVLTIQADRIHEFDIRGRQGLLRVQVQPWASVKIDGREVGITPLAPVPLLEGTHKIELENPEVKRRYTSTAKIAPGETNEVKLNLLELGDPM
jgi:serine/threonine protein kinase